jgi:hypothetical protein
LPRAHRRSFDLWRHAAAKPTQGTRARDGRGDYRRDIATVEREDEACRLAAQGWTLDAIKELGFSHRAKVSRAINRMLLGIARTGDAEELRVKQLTEMAELRRKMRKWPASRPRSSPASSRNAGAASLSPVWSTRIPNRAPPLPAETAE